MRTITCRLNLRKLRRHYYLSAELVVPGLPEPPDSEYPWQQMPVLDRLHFRIMMTGNYTLLKHLTRLRTALGRLTGRQP